MNQLEVYRAWTPERRPWSPWVKPALFAHLPLPPTISSVPEPIGPELSLEWLRSRWANAALVLDLPGAESVRLGVRLARQYGWQPVPLFSSVPAESAAWPQAVPTLATLQQLEFAADALAGLRETAASAPAFLVDAQRRGVGFSGTEVNRFDNRSALFGSDFPSAAQLRSHGINRCIVVHDPSLPLHPDLGYALLPWRQAGCEIEVLEPDGRPIAAAWPRGGFWGQLLHRLRTIPPLRPNACGGFGRFVPESSGGSTRGRQAAKHGRPRGGRPRRTLNSERA